MWTKYNEKKPPLGIEVLAQSDEWKDEDYNPQGIRIGFQNESEDEDGHFVSAKWNNTHDCYDTDDKTTPIKWNAIISPASEK